MNPYAAWLTFCIAYFVFDWGFAYSVLAAMLYAMWFA